MPPLDPMEIDKVVVEQDGGTSAFNLKSTFRDAQIIGLAPSKILRSALRFNKKFALRSDSYTDRLDFVGQYTMNGQILVLPIRGVGFANVSMQQLTTRHDINGEYFTGEDGNKYLNVTQYIIKFKPKKVTFRFDNLFNGDKLLGDTMNKFMNDNWDPVFSGMIPGMSL
jgi:Haemolymph juvenile hormone binding protein (JHBP)